MKKEKGGQKKPAKDKHILKIVCHVTREQHNLFMSKACIAGQTLSEWARSAMREASEK